MIRLKRSTEILLAGLAVAGLVLAAGTANTLRLQRREQALIASCKAHKTLTLSPRSANEPPPNAVLSKLPDDDLLVIKEVGDLTKVSDDEIGPLAAKHNMNVFALLEAREHLHDAMARLDVLWDNESCDPQVLASAKGVRWIYADLLAADRSVAAAQSVPFELIALVVAALCALPWTWYFLLRRIAELRAAIAGNPPGG